MTVLLSRIVPDDGLAAVHAPLGEVEWPGTIRHVKAALSPTVRAGMVTGGKKSPRVGAISRNFRPSAFAWSTSRRSSSPYSRLRYNPPSVGDLCAGLAMEALTLASTLAIGNTPPSAAPACPCIEKICIRFDD